MLALYLLITLKSFWLSKTSLKRGDSALSNLFCQERFALRQVWPAEETVVVCAVPAWGGGDAINETD